MRHLYRAVVFIAIAVTLLALINVHRRLRRSVAPITSPAPRNYHPPPPPPPPVIIEDFRLPAAPASLTLTFGTAAVWSYVHNWLHHARKLSDVLKPYAAVALDAELERLCRLHGEPTLSARSLLLRSSTNSLVSKALTDLSASAYARNEPTRFKQLGYLKALTTAALLEMGYDVLLSDADCAFLGNPWPWIGRPGVPLAADAGDLPSADVLATNDLPDLRRDGQPDSVYNTGVAFFRAAKGDGLAWRDGRARRFALEWANRTLTTGVIGNDQTELNRLLRNRYVDSDYTCNRPECLAPDPRIFVPARARFEGGDRCPAAAISSSSNATEAYGSELIGTCDQRLCEFRLRVPAAGGIDLHRADQLWRTCERTLQRASASGGGGGAHLPSRRIYWSWGGRVTFGLLPMDRFLQGNTFWVQRLHVLRGVEPVHVHVTYAMGSDYGKRWRLRSAGLWVEPPSKAATTDPAAQTTTTTVKSAKQQPLHVSGMHELLYELIQRMELPEEVWQCEAPPTAAEKARGILPDQPSEFFKKFGEKRCYHPKKLAVPLNNKYSKRDGTWDSNGGLPPYEEHSPHREDLKLDWEHTLDPAAPHVAVQYVSRLVVRNALALAYALGRPLILPQLWSLCERHWWQLNDCRIPGIDRLPMPYAAPHDLLFNLESWQMIRGVEITVSGGGGEERTSTQSSADGKPVTLISGSAVDDAAKSIAAVRLGSEPLRVDATSLLRLSSCGFANATMARLFQMNVLQHTFAGQYSFCGEERNPHVQLLLLEARARKLPEEVLLKARRNCTGQPANDFNKPKVDLGAEALAFKPSGSCGAEGLKDGAEVAMERAQVLVRPQWARWDDSDESG